MVDDKVVVGQSYVQVSDVSFASGKSDLFLGQSAHIFSWGDQE
jgi:hypothetical protein